MKIVARVLAVSMIASSMTATLGLVAPGEALAASKSYCKAYAKKKANKRAGVPQVLTGAAVGAGLGALAGAIVGGRHSVGRGALIGGVGGTVVGGVSANHTWRAVYNDAYNYCRYNM